MDNLCISHPQGENLKMYFLAFDAKCFPKEMHLDEGELGDLFVEGTIGILALIDHKPVGLAVLADELTIEAELQEDDPEFKASDQGAYSYSVAVMPEHTGKGIGTRLLREAIDLARARGKSYVTAHVRTSNNWHKKRAEVLKPTARRMLPGFWDIDGAVEFQHVPIRQK